MEYNSQGGYYSPSLYKISLKTDQPLNNIQQLPPEVLSTFFHEYFHYVQDITTVFGISQAWNFYNRIRQMIGYIQNSDKEIIDLPLNKDPKVKELLDYFEIQKEIAGDWNIEIFGFPLNEVEIKGIDFIEREFTSKYESGAKYPCLTVQSLENGANYQYMFGAVAIIESMTAIIQEKFFEKKDYRDLPYRAVNKIVGFQFQGEKVADEVLFALCDVSLLSPYPSIAFFDILNLFKNLPTNGESIYEIGMQYINSKWPLWNFYDNQLSGLNDSVSQLYGTDFFKYDIQWFAFVLANGIELRKSDNMFMLRLFREDAPFDNKVMNKIKYQLGAPELINANNERWFSSPMDLREIEDNINTMFLIVYQKLHDLFLFGNVNDNIPGEAHRHCRLKNHCMGSNRKMPVNQDCIDAPWKKASEEQLCAFGAVYYLNGLTKKQLRFN